MNTKIDSNLLRRVAKNARLELSPDEEERFLKEMREILEVFSVLDELDVKDVKPSFQPVPLKNRWREDVLEECLSNETALSNTVHKKDGYFKGPKVM